MTDAQGVSVRGKPASAQSHLILTGRLHAYLADINEQAQSRYRRIVWQMMKAEGMTRDLKRRSQWALVKGMNSIVSCAEEVIRSEIM